VIIELQKTVSMPLLPSYDSLNWIMDVESDNNEIFREYKENFKNILKDIEFDDLNNLVGYSSNQFDSEEPHVYGRIKYTYLEKNKNRMNLLSQEIFQNFINDTIKNKYDVSYMVLNTTVKVEDEFGKIINLEVMDYSYNQNLNGDNLLMNYSIKNFLNIFPLYESFTMYKILCEMGYPRPMIFSSSIFIGIGQYSGIVIKSKHNTYSDMKKSLKKAVKMNYLGNPHVFNEVICSEDSQNIDVEVCIRWTQMICLFPHAGIKKLPYLNLFSNQDRKDHKDYYQIFKKTLNIRYMFSLYLYSYFIKMSLEGGSLIRTLFLDFKSKDYKTILFEIDEQFMVGSAIMMNPIFKNGISDKLTYFPSDKFYDFYTGHLINTNEGFFKLNVPIDRPAIYIRGGYIIPIQNYDLEKNLSSRLEEKIINDTINDVNKIKKYPIDFIVALDQNFRANGWVMFDDSITPTSKNDLFSQKLFHKLEISAYYYNNVFNISFHISSKNKIFWSKKYRINKIFIFGFTAFSIKKITIINKEGRTDINKDSYNFDMTNDILVLNDLNLYSELENKITIVI